MYIHTLPNYGTTLTKKHLFTKELKELKEYLDKTKNKINDIDKKVLDKLVNRYFLFSDIKFKLRKSLGVSYITNAWIKTYEIFYIFKQELFHSNNKTIYIFFNANAPGTSTEAVKFLIDKHYPKISMEWVSSTYLDKEDTLQDTYGLIKKNKSKWLMNSDNNGDVTKLSNIKDFNSQIRSKFNSLCDIYFSDIAINIKEDYNNEELLESKEVFGQNISGLNSIKLGGHYIVKQRGSMLPLSIWFISILNKCFKKVHITKPCSSKPCNSEIYIVALGFKGIHPQTLELMFRTLVNFNIRSSPYKVLTPICMDTYQSIYKAIQSIVNSQVLHINNMLSIAPITDITAYLEKIELINFINITQ